MTAENFLQEHLEISHFYNDKYEQTCCFSTDIQKAMKEFATLKCQQLLEIVAEKADAKIQYISGSVNRAVVNKDSILKAVNLDEFIN